MQEDRLSDCAREVRRHDRDRYLTCLFAPPPERESLFALYAFNLEVSKTAEIVSEDTLGLIRLQWWRDCVEKMYEGTPPRHYVSEPLAGAIRERRLTRAHFTRLIDTRERDLEEGLPETLSDLEDYAEGTSASLVHLAMEILGEPDEAATRAARHVGIAWALTGLTRAIPFHARQKRCVIPRTLLETTGVELGQLFELRGSPAVNSAARQLAETANAHLKAARQARVSRALRPALLLAPLADHYLRRLRKAGFDPFDPELAWPSGTTVWRLAWWTIRRRF